MTRAFLLAAACLSLSACWRPAFDEAIVDSERFADQLGAPAKSFELSVPDSSTGEFTYIPPRDPAYYGQGWLVWNSGGTVSVRSVYLGSGGPAVGYNGSNQYASAGDLFQAVPAYEDPTKLVFWPGSSYGSTALVSDGSGNLSVDSSYNVSACVGGGSAAFSVLNVEWSRFFYPAAPIAGMLPLYYVSYNGGSVLSASPGSESLAWPNTMPLVLGSEPVFAAVFPVAGVAWVSGTTSSGAPATYRWTGGTGNFSAAPVALDWVDQRVTGILSDQRLVAAHGGKLTLYDVSASSKTTLRLGSARFVGERHDDASGVWLSVFTRALSADPNEGGNRKYRIEIWEHPTADLDGLAD